jgi:transcriptional regulator
LHFVESRTEVLHDLISCYPLGALVTHGAQGLDANHIPFELDRAGGELGTLRAHVARQNEVWQLVKSGERVLVMFRAEDAYISPNWYPSKHEFHKQVPTWNYRVVHAHGRITVHDDERFVRGLVARLTRQHEASQPVPWKMGEAPQDYIDTMLKAIVGIEIEITQLVGKFKLSQNREVRDRLGAADALIGLGDTGLGHSMRDALPPGR